jgi:hypothetical protein
MWTSAEKVQISHFNHPFDIQSFLDSIPYNPVGECRSPRLVLTEPKAHCFEGALFAAAMLREMGHLPLIVDMAAENDDDHVIAVFRTENLWGAIAKSNTSALRYREPVYRNLRELIMSYFDFYFNTLGVKSLRSYSRPVNLNRFNMRNWATSSEDLEYIGDYLYTVRHYPVAGPGVIAGLQKADKLLMDAVFLGANEEGLFKAESS